MRARKGLESLQALNRRARDHAFDADAIDWSLGVDTAKPWEPEDMNALWFVPSFALLEPCQRLRCNQLHALAVSEQFVWFETQLVRAIDRLLAGAPLPAALDEALRHFVREERKHIEMFWRLLELSAPAWYAQRAARLFAVSPLEQLASDCMTGNPRAFVAWVWLAIFVEERTLYISRLHMQAHKRAPDSLDALHSQVHAFHFRDEVRHYQLDQHLLTWLYDPQPRWKRRLAALMFQHVLRAFVGARRTAGRILAQLGEEFPALRARALPAMRAELPGVAHDRRYQEKHFSPCAQPRTFALLAEYREHEALWRMLPAAGRGRA